MAAWSASAVWVKCRPRWGSRSRKPAASSHMRQSGQVAHAACQSTWINVWWRRSRGCFSGRRPAMKLRAADRKDDLVEQPVDPQARILALAEAHADIDLLMGQIDQPVGNVDAHIGIGMALEKAVQARHQPFGGERGRGRRRQPRPCNRRCAAARTVRAMPSSASLTPASSMAPGLGQFHDPAGALEELDAQLVLEIAHAIADGCGRHAQLLRRAAETAAAGRPLRSSSGRPSPGRCRAMPYLQEKLIDQSRTTRLNPAAIGPISLRSTGP